MLQWKIRTAKDVAFIGKRLKQAGKPGFGMILKMAAHQYKKRSLYRPLSVACDET